MTISSTIVQQFLSMLRRCVPTGESTVATPLIRLKATNAKLTLLGMNADVSLSQTIDGAFTGCDFALVADRLAGCIPANKEDIVFEPKHPEAVELSSVGNTFEPVLLTMSIAHLCLSDRQARDCKIMSYYFVQAMRDATRLVRRNADHRYAYHRLLIDAPLGRIVATDGIVLFVHGGLPLKGPSCCCACGIYLVLTSLASRNDVGVSITTDRVTIEKGAWSVTLPVDRRARMPNYDELLIRLRRPIARFTLTEMDAKLWMHRTVYPTINHVRDSLICKPTVDSFRRSSWDEEAYKGDVLC